MKLALGRIFAVGVAVVGPCACIGCACIGNACIRRSALARPKRADVCADLGSAIATDARAGNDLASDAAGHRRWIVAGAAQHRNQHAHHKPTHLTI